MTGFLKGLWRTISAMKNAAGNLIFLTLLVLILAALFSSETPTVPDTAALILNPTGVIVDQKTIGDPIAEFIAGYQDEEAETLHRDLLEAISKGAADDRIRMLVLDLYHLRGASLSKLEEIGNAIDRFRESGKPVWAFAPAYSQSQYLIAAHADRIVLDRSAFNPLGSVFLTGIGVYPTYFKSALDKLRIRFHVFKAGLYKGAVEPFIRDDMSDEAREANSAWLGVLWNQYRDTVITRRGIEAEDFSRYTNRYDEVLAEHIDDPARLVLDNRLVDDVLSLDEWREAVREIAGADDHSYRHVTYKTYLAATRPPLPVPAKGDQIAVITAAGTILDGEAPPGSIGGDSLSKLIRKARENEQVKAVVMRIDSPGGSAAASEQIRHELELTQDKGKPVIVSMSGYAASGGYWMASTANRIFTARSTITGSIGTFILFPTFEESLAELGINSDGVGTTSLSDAFNPLEPLNPVLMNTLKLSVENTYRRFLELVARGREMSVDEVDGIAQGRVWTGETAVELGLVDSIGNLDDAIRSAAVLADIDDYDVLYLEKELSAREKIMQQILDSSLKTIHRVTGGVSTHWQLLGDISDRIVTSLDIGRGPGIYLQCLYCNVR